MNNFSSLTTAQLRRAADIQEQIEALNHQLTSLLNGGVSAPAPASSQETLIAQPAKTRKKYKLSAAGREKKVAAQKARWAKVKTAAKADNSEVKPGKKRRKMSAAGRAKIAAAVKARWAKVKAGKAGR
jgi:hypothetical protein